MSKTPAIAFPKARPQRLDQEASRSLRQKILERDGWRCQACGSMQNLQVHHQQFRSHCGADIEDNLITPVCELPWQDPYEDDACVWQLDLSSDQTPPDPRAQ